MNKPLDGYKLPTRASGYQLGGYFQARRAGEVGIRSWITKWRERPNLVQHLDSIIFPVNMQLSLTRYGAFLPSWYTFTLTNSGELGT
jgi:hypothetical protein